MFAAGVICTRILWLIPDLDFLLLGIACCWVSFAKFNSWPVFSFSLGRQAFVSPAAEFPLRRPTSGGGQLGPDSLRQEAGDQEAVPVADHPRAGKGKAGDSSKTTNHLCSYRCYQMIRGLFSLVTLIQLGSSNPTSVHWEEIWTLIPWMTLVPGILWDTVTSGRPNSLSFEWLDYTMKQFCALVKALKVRDQLKHFFRETRIRQKVCFKFC